MPETATTCRVDADRDPLICQACGARAVVHALHRTATGRELWSVAACRACAAPYLAGATETTWLYVVPEPGAVVVVGGQLAVVTHSADYRDFPWESGDGHPVDHLIEVTCLGGPPTVGDNASGIYDQDEYRPATADDVRAAAPGDLEALRALGARLPGGGVA